jgi:hypothetical protein
MHNILVKQILNDLLQLVSNQVIVNSVQLLLYRFTIILSQSDSLFNVHINVMLGFLAVKDNLLQ